MFAGVLLCPNSIPEIKEKDSSDQIGFYYSIAQDHPFRCGIFFSQLGFPGFSMVHSFSIVSEIVNQ